MSRERLSDSEQISQLKDENAALNEQIKLLVQTEQRLYRSQNELDREFSRVRALAEFALHCAEIDSVDQIVNGAALLIHGLFYVDSITFVQLENDGTLAAISDFPRGDNRKKSVISVDPSQFDWLRRMSEASLVRISEQEAVLNLRQRLAAIDRSLESSAATPIDSAGQWSQIVVPLRNTSDQLSGVILLGRRYRRESYFKEYADQRHLPFLELLASHLARALHNAELTENLRSQGRELIAANRRLKHSISDLEASERRFRELAEHIRAVFWIMDPHVGKISYLSPAFLTTWGRSPGASDELTRLFVAGIHPEDRARVLELKEQHLLGETTRVEYRVVQPDGTTRWIWDCGYPVRDNSGRVNLVFGVAEDITTLKSTTEEIGRLQRLEMAGKIAGQIAHDFNNLLAPLTAYPQLLRERIDPSASEHAMLTTMQTAAQRIADINQQLLTLGRRGHYDRSALILNDVVSEAIETLELPEEIDLRVDLADNLLPLRGGSSQLVRVISNLLRNAFDAVDAADGRGTIEVETRNIYFDEERQGYESIHRGEFVLLEISDDGIGIAENELDRIFDPFYSTKKMDRERGSGLGLSVVHGVVADHDGSLDVRSTEGAGATFSLYFPVARETVDAADSVDRNPRIQRGCGESIVLIDDDPLQREVVSSLLQSLGYRVDTAASGEEALEKLKLLRPDLVLLDMIMPGIDGTETLRRILKRRPDQSVLLISGYAQADRVDEARRLGAKGFLAKPLTREALAQALRSALC